MDMLKALNIKADHHVTPRRQPKIGLTLGDPGGVGPEVIAKSLASIFLDHNQSFPFTPILFGSKSVIQDPYIQSLLPPVEIVYSQSKVVEESDKKILVYECDADQQKSNPEKSNPEKSNQIKSSINPINGALSYNYLTRAIDCAIKKQIDGIVTGPINKEAWRLAGIDYSGHTTCLKVLTQSKEVSMGFYSSKLKTVLTTIHIPLSQVSEQLSEKKLEIALKNCFQLMKISGIASPKIALAGLNPHAGENGQFGTEENDLLIPFVQKHADKGLFGPFPPDTLYHRAYEGEFDCVISLYHDQGLIPLKLVAFHEAVNISLGLPFVRTSPDHGTCFELAHQNKANYSSMNEAIKLCLKACLISLESKKEQLNPIVS